MLSQIDKDNQDIVRHHTINKYDIDESTMKKTQTIKSMFVTSVQVSIIQKW